ncbi:MAG: ABC transporter permease subunit [Pseudomonadales bacterium]|nr:ABC transporter permease subunit [Pseudomonadales bacterium]
MAGLNYKVHIEERPAADVAKEFLASLDVHSTHETATLFDKLVERTIEHLYLAGIALLAATIVALAISITVYSIPWLSRLLQTIPSLALLALMVPLFGIGTLPAIVALFLYSLLPIIRTTVTALSTVDPVLVQVADGLGYTRAQTLLHVKIPLSMPAIFAGIRISAILCIGTATLAAFIGGGGLGDLIFQGLQLDDTRLILIGAASAASMAIIVELLFEGVEKLIIPGHIAASNKISNDPVVV